MTTPHDFGYWFGYGIGIILFLVIPLLVIGGVLGFWRRMWPAMLSITTLFIHGHRRPQ